MHIPNKLTPRDDSNMVHNISYRMKWAKHFMKRVLRQGNFQNKLLHLSQNSTSTTAMDFLPYLHAFLSPLYMQLLKHYKTCKSLCQASHKTTQKCQQKTTKPPHPQDNLIIKYPHKVSHHFSISQHSPTIRSTSPITFRFIYRPLIIP